MDFINSLSEVAKNRQNFKKWEEQQKDNQAQREELAKKRQYTQAELQQAKEFGKTIIDVVDIMDNHSENVAENVETAVDPLSSLVTLVTFFGGNWLVGKHSSTKLVNKISDIQHKFRESEEAKVLAKKISEFNEKKGKDKWFDEWDLLRKDKINRIKDPNLKKEARTLYDKVQKQIKPLRNKVIRNHIGVAGASILAFIAATIMEAKLQTDSSKIARYQARKELEDPKAFVNYTPEQIEAAKKELQEHPELLKKEKKSKLKSGMFRSIFNIIKDRRAYLKDKSARTDDSQKVTRQLTAEEVKQAKKDQEVIQRTVRLINNEAEKYSENMEVAANVIMGATPVLGATIGAATGWILEKSGVLNKFVENTIKKYGSEETQQLYNEFKSTKKTGSAYHAQWTKLVDSLMEGKNKSNIETAKDEAANGMKKAARKKIKFGEITDKFFAAGFTHKWGKKGILGLFGGIVSGFAGLMIGLKLQKSAARAGRYTAKRELEKDPANFIGYTEEDYNEVKDVKSNKKNTNKIKEYALFIPNVLKQYWAYNKYKKNEYKEKVALNELLKKQEVTSTQMRDAKNLQRKVFNTFEKVDDNSQVYSESMEAATEIAQPFIWYGGMALAASPLIVTGIQVARGKMSVAKLLDKITNKLSTSSNLMKKNWFKKYLNGVADNVTRKVNNVNLKEIHYMNNGHTTIEPKPLGAMFKNIDFKNDPIIEVVRKIIVNSQNGTDNIRKMTNEEQINYLFTMKDKLEKLMDNSIIFDSAINKQDINKFFEILINGGYYNKNTEKYIHVVDRMTPELRANILDMFVNPKNLNEETAWKVHDILADAVGPKFAGSIFEISSHMAGSLEFIKSKQFKQVIAELSQSITQIAEENNGYVPLTNEMITFFEKFLGKEEFNKHLSELSQLSINDLMSPKAGIVDPKDIPNLTGISLREATSLLHAVTDKAQKVTIKEAVGFIPQRLKNPKNVLSEMKSKIQNMTAEEFEDFAYDTLHISSMDKETMLKIIPRLEKIFDNIPKEQMNKISDALVKALQENPDELMQLVMNGKIKSIFMTPELQKTLAAAGITWTVFSILLTYTVEAIMADMQLKAGRLGVMKAMESLQDPAYYANIEPTETAAQKNSADTKTEASTMTKVPDNIQSGSSTNLLAKFKKAS